MHDDSTMAVLDRASQAGVRITEVASRIIGMLATTKTPQGIVAVVEAAPVSPEEIAPDATLVLVLDGVRDPGNAGTLARSALAAGADALVFGEMSVDPFHPKVVRASAGALLHLPIIDDADLEVVLPRLRSHGLVAVGADSHSNRPLDEVDLSGPVAIVIGNEGAGLGDAVTEACDVVVSIPMPGPTESLNAGIAGSVILFECVRQRRAVTRLSSASP